MPDASWLQAAAGWSGVRHRLIRGPALPSRTDAWSSPGDPRSCGLALHGAAGHGQPARIRAPGNCGATAGHLSAGLSAAGERLGPDDIWVSRIGWKDLMPGVLAPGPRPLDTDLLYCYLFGRPPCPGPVVGPGRGWDLFFEGTLRTGAAVGVTRRCAYGWNLPRCPLARQCRRAGTGHGGAAGGSAEGAG